MGHLDLPLSKFVPLLILYSSVLNVFSVMKFCRDISRNFNIGRPSFFLFFILFYLVFMFVLFRKWCENPLRMSL